MKRESREIERSRRAVEAARHRFTGTLGEVQARLAPDALAQEAWRNARERGEQAARDTLAAARARPALSATLAGLLLLYCARRPLWWLAARMFSGRRTVRETRRESGAVGQPAPGAAQEETG